MKAREEEASASRSMSPSFVTVPFDEQGFEFVDEILRSDVVRNARLRFRLIPGQRTYVR